jgi:hypothetical protein
VRKMRVLFWTGVGLVLLARRGLTANQAVAVAEDVRLQEQL